MTQYDNTNSGALFRNQKKETEKHPDHTGTINVEGREFWLSAWIKTSKSGQKFFSLSVKPKDGAAPAKPVQQTQANDFDDSIPFAIFLAPLAGVLAYAAYAQNVLPL